MSSKSTLKWSPSLMRRLPSFSTAATRDAELQLCPAQNGKLTKSTRTSSERLTLAQKAALAPSGFPLISGKALRLCFTSTALKTSATWISYCDRSILGILDRRWRRRVD
ncbi:hypothetical protein RB7731 [Rhodopirellula baltica SH 1]|uniref:Uncharacterized protein n=1 Tax=Rhodopirellula baltica (strain DSM 10527 / NCIMB 13988 / SH1) TaxID=243090 RepID=Q7UN81_RHOBA|nr:hypothetical protein RB7731 [Rhodopirellula baltica SH 1]